MARSEGFLETISTQYDAISAEIVSLQSSNKEKDDEISELKEELAEYNRLKVLLEDIDTFQFTVKLNEPELIEAARLICVNLYPNHTRAYIDWKENGGKRAKDPARQLFMDVIRYVIMEKRDWLRTEFRNSGISYRNDILGVQE